MNTPNTLQPRKALQLNPLPQWASQEAQRFIEAIVTDIALHCECHIEATLRVATARFVLRVEQMSLH